MTERNWSEADLLEADRLDTTINVPDCAGELREFTKPYWQLVLEGQEDPAKQVARDKVGRFLLDNTRRGQEQRLLSLPGMLWLFESQMHAALRMDLRVVGIERNLEVVRRGMPYMIGNGRFRTELRTRLGTIQTFSSSNAVLVHADAATFLGLKKRDVGGTSAQQGHVRTHRRWSMVWLDFCGPVSASTLQAIRRVPLGLNQNRSCCPVAISVLGAREPGYIGDLLDESEDRGDLIIKALSDNSIWSYDHKETFKYVSSTGMPMMTVMGVCSLLTQPEGSRVCAT